MILKDPTEACLYHSVYKEYASVLKYYLIQEAEQRLMEEQSKPRFWILLVAIQLETLLWYIENAISINKG